MARAVRATSPGQRALPPRTVFVLMLVSSALVIGAVAGGGEGVSRNAFFDLIIASALFGALGLEWLGENRREPRILRMSVAPATVALCGVGLSLHAIASWPATLQALREVDDLEQDTRITVEMIARLGQGHAACETLALCYWAHSSFTLDFFTYGQKVSTGTLAADACKAAFERGDFPVLQLEANRGPESGRLGPCSEAISRYYVEAFRSRVATLFVPRQARTTYERVRTVSR